MRSSNHVSELGGVRGLPARGYGAPGFEGDYLEESALSRCSITDESPGSETADFAEPVRAYPDCRDPRGCSKPECQANRNKYGYWPKGPFWPCAVARWSPLAEAEHSAALEALEALEVWFHRPRKASRDEVVPAYEPVAGGVVERAQFAMVRREGRAPWMSDDELIAFIREGGLLTGRLDE